MPIKKNLLEDGFSAYSLAAVNNKFSQDEQRNVPSSSLVTQINGHFDVRNSFCVAITFRKGFEFQWKTSSYRRFAVASRLYFELRNIALGLQLENDSAPIGGDDRIK